MHGDHLRTAYLPDTETDAHAARAQGLEQALTIFDKLENDDWDEEMAATALRAVEVEDDPHVDADALADLSQHVQEGDHAVQHRVIGRISAGTKARGYWALVKDFFGVNNRA